jgi:hypothetical protein
MIKSLVRCLRSVQIPDDKISFLFYLRRRGFVKFQLELIYVIVTREKVCWHFVVVHADVTSKERYHRNGQKEVESKGTHWGSPEQAFQQNPHRAGGNWADHATWARGGWNERHTLRKPQTSIARQALQQNPQGRRKLGWPRNMGKRRLNQKAHTEEAPNKHSQTSLATEPTGQEETGLTTQHAGQEVESKGTHWGSPEQA